MSDEEKKAIEWLKKADWFSARLYSPTILNLIEKQFKEIEELKEKNNKLMEELDLTTVYISGVYDGEKKVEDKIKAKIEEYKKEQEFYNKNEDREWGQFNNWDWIDRIINEMQSLLEKE